MGRKAHRRHEVPSQGLGQISLSVAILLTHGDHSIGLYVAGRKLFSAVNPQTVPGTQGLLSNQGRVRGNERMNVIELVGARPLEGMEQMTLVGSEQWCQNSI